MLTASAPGYYIFGDSYVPGDDDIVMTLEAHANQDNPGYEWISGFARAGEEGNCENCHADPDNGSSTLPFDEWVNDAHGQSATNPRFLTMYTGTDVNGNRSPVTQYGYNRDYGRFPLRPDLTHPYYGPGYQLDFPETKGNCAACHTPAAAINVPYSTDPTTVTGVGEEGVACDFCHKVWDVQLDPATGLPFPNMPGVLSFQFLRPPEGHQFFAGPLDDVGFPGSEDAYSPLQNESAFCAPCHFAVFWDTTIYNSFGEWLASPYSDPETGQTCQDCHMPNGGANYFARADVGGLERDSETIFSHLMPGAADLDLLQNTAKLDITTERDGDTLTVEVRVTNTNAGHHIPTDSPLRQILLVVEVTDANGNPIALESGTTLPEWTGDLAGQPGVYYAKILEEIWTEISPTGAYWSPTRIVEDTRLAAFESHSSSYTFAVDQDQSAMIEVRLIFRRAYYDLMQQKGWVVPDIIMESEIVTVK
jgi:mono/diheme cytochrome c family protein